MGTRRRSARCDAASRRNQRYLPEAEFPEALQMVSDLHRSAQECPRCADRRALACVSRDLREHSAALGPPTRASPGQPRDSRLRRGMLPHQVVREVLGDTTGCRLVGPHLREGSRRRTAHRHDRRIGGRAFRQGTCVEPVGPEFPRLYADRHHGRGGRRRREECHRHRLRDRRRHGLRRQYARGIDHARARRNDAPGGQARRAARNFHGPCRSWRSGADLYRRSIAQSPLRHGVGPRRNP